MAGYYVDSTDASFVTFHPTNFVDYSCQMQENLPI
jgi:hypothetical protein